MQSSKGFSTAAVEGAVTDEPSPADPEDRSAEDRSAQDVGVSEEKRVKLERARLVSASCNAMDEEGVWRKPPSSHINPSLLYDPLAR